MGNRPRLQRKAPARTPGYRAERLNRVQAIQQTLSGRYNAYLCDKCDKGYLTIDINEGTTPMFAPCYATYGCNGIAHSAGYPEGDPPKHLGEAIIQWYKPTVEEFRKLSHEMQEHVRKGGLVRKATQAAPRWVQLAVGT
jgi:hypothetical protein